MSSDTNKVDDIVKEIGSIKIQVDLLHKKIRKPTVEANRLTKNVGESLLSTKCKIKGDRVIVETLCKLSLWVED